MTRNQIRSALNHILGNSSPERILRELQTSIMNRRANGTKPMRELHAADFEAIGNVFRQLRTAAAKTPRR